MKASRFRWIAFLLAIAVGLAAGLYYGWVVNPAKYTDTTPNTLRADYKADFALMVAEAYQADGDLEAARRTLALLGLPPTEAVQEAIAFGISHGYASQDLYVLQQLLAALQQAPTGENTP